MRLDLDFGHGLVAHVQLDNISTEQYRLISEFFEPKVNDPAFKTREAIGVAFRFATDLCPDANPSDIWHHVLYRICKRAKIGTNPEQSWVRTSGEGFELALIERYNPILLDDGLRLHSLISGSEKRKALQRMGIAGKVGSSKVDVLIERLDGGIDKDASGWGIVGGLHAKVSLAERISDDIPASRIMMEMGLLSVLSTLDVKSFPPPHGDLVNRGEFGSPAKPSDKRKYVEEHGDFSAAFSYNLRTAPSPAVVASGRRIFVLPFSGGRDYFTKFLVESTKR